MAKKQEQINEQRVVNTTAQRLELVFGDKTYVFLPGKVVKVPNQYTIPKNIGLLVK